MSLAPIHPPPGKLKLLFVMAKMVVWGGVTVNKNTNTYPRHPQHDACNGRQRVNVSVGLWYQGRGNQHFHAVVDLGCHLLPMTQVCVCVLSKEES